MSEKLFSGFDTVDKQEWLSKIEKDAKGKSIIDFEWQVNPQLVQSPFVRKTDLEGEHNSITRNKVRNSWYVCEFINPTTPYKTNQEILKSLEQGASALEVFIDKKLNQKEFSKLFKEVNFTYVNSVFEFENITLAESVINELLHYTTQNGQDTAEIRGGIRIKNQLEFDGAELLKKFQKLLPKFSFAYASCDNLFGYKETVIHEIGSLLVGLKNILDSKRKHYCIDLNVNISKSYFLNIAKLRAIHLISNNLVKLFNSSSKIRLHAKLALQSISENENQNLIQFTSQAMSAVIGGVYSLRLPASDDYDLRDGSANRKRLSRNIQSLIQMESFMGNVLDPSAGSYYIESLTDEISKQVWAYLQNNS